MTTDYNKTDGIHQLQESSLDTIRPDHHTHQYTHCQHNIHKHHTDGRQAQHTKTKDA